MTTDMQHDEGLFPPPEPTTLGTADLSTDGVYRWELTRMWDRSKGRVCWVMLNPSTADGQEDDATIRRCKGFARAWGYGGIVVRNLYALRSTDPANLWSHPDPIGASNGAYLNRCALDELVVCAWGVHGARNNRGDEVVAMLARQLAQLNRKLHHIGLTKDGQPGHPLYVKATQRPIRWDNP